MQESPELGVVHMLVWIIAFAGTIAIAAVTFVAVAVLWLRKLRETVSKALTESANQQIRTAQRLGEAVALVQKQQRAYEQQLHNLAQASLKLRQELTTVATRLEHSDTTAPGDRTVH
jgi:hypothetical protein